MIATSQDLKSTPRNHQQERATCETPEFNPLTSVNFHLDSELIRTSPTLQNLSTPAFKEVLTEYYRQMFDLGRENDRLLKVAVRELEQLKADFFLLMFKINSPIVINKPDPYQIPPTKEAVLAKLQANRIKLRIKIARLTKAIAENLEIKTKIKGLFTDNFSQNRIQDLLDDERWTGPEYQKMTTFYAYKLGEIRKSLKTNTYNLKVDRIDRLHQY
ncbi:MAG: hypothetical protein H7230_04640 [Candidatus Parcubacteria bacterium]|nr:hypothetical protein [Candidatus Paceibacterota bacterium]